MKKLFVFCALILAASVSFSQTVVVLNYMKVPPGGGDAYEEAEKYARKVMQHRVDEGKMIGWELWRVMNQTAESDYHYVTADIYEDLAASLKGIPWEDVEAALGEKAGEAADAIMSSRTMTYRETYQFVMGIPIVGEENYMVVNYMKAKDPGTHVALEGQILPIHELAIADGAMAGWSVWSPMLFDERTTHTAITVDGFTSLDQIAAVNYGKYYDEHVKTLSDKEAEELDAMFDQISAIRTQQKVQVWQKVAAATPKDN